MLSTALLSGVAVFGCSGPKAGDAASPAMTVASPLVESAPSRIMSEKLTPKPRLRVTKRKANRKGDILILEYHHVAEKEDRWARSRENFRADLERLYKLGYRPVTLAEYIEGKMQLPPGASPVVITFDDAHPNQFLLNKDGSIDPETAVGIWKSFSDAHPDFPVKGTWFVVPAMGFGQPKLVGKKFKMLQDWGSEIAVHTLTHGRLDRMDDERVKQEIGGCMDFLSKHGVKPKTIAYPFGIRPSNRALAKGFEWKGKKYRLIGGVLAGAGPAPSVKSKEFKAHALPRIQAIEGDYGITYWLNLAKKGKVRLYVEP